MKNRNITNFWHRLFFIVLIASLAGCGEMLDNPTIDKDTGEDISLLLIDFNFFDTRASFTLIDASDNSSITSTATIWFTGNNANDIVNFAGEKNDSYTTSEGQLELTFDPNVEVSSSSPLEFTVHVEIDGYQTYSQGLQINSEGIKTFELPMSTESDGEDTVLDGTEDPNDDGSIILSYFPQLKSTNIEEVSYEVGYSITKADIVNFLDSDGNKMFEDIEELEEALDNNPTNFLSMEITKHTDFQILTTTIIDEEGGDSQLALYQQLEKGSLKKLSVTGRQVSSLNEGIIKSVCSYLGSPSPDYFGFMELDDDARVFKGRSQNYTDLDFSYTVACAWGELCTLGSSIQFSSNMVSGFSIDADIYNATGDKIKTETFTGNFPETFTLENVPASSAKVVFRNNNPSFEEIPDLEIENLCSGSYEVDVEAAEDYSEYQVVLKALCSDNTSIAIAPTYSGEYRIKDSDDEWQGADMIGGVANILAKPNQEYQIRLLWEEEWETTDFSTTIDDEGNIVDNSGSTTTSEILSDGRIRINVEHVFQQSVCESLGW
jgi:hypothetical protein